MMAEPIASSSNTRKTKKHRDKNNKLKHHRAVSSPADVGAAVSAAPTAEVDESRLRATATDSEHDVDFGEFDYDAVNADGDGDSDDGDDDDGGGDGAELWLVRAPITVKAKSLHGIEISMPRIKGATKTKTKVTRPVGELVRKNVAYDLWALEPTGTTVDGGAHVESEDQDGGLGAEDVDVDVDAVGVSAEELNSLSVLLPCKRKGGKLYLARKPVTRHLVIAARPAKPTRPDAFRNPKREAYPEEVLTHRFRPYGDPGDHPPPLLPPEDHRMDVETATEVRTKEKEKHKRRGSEGGSSKKKKAKLVVS